MINITLIQRLLLNCLEAKSNYFLLSLCFLSRIISAVSNELDNSITLLISTTVFYLLLFIIQLKKSSVSKIKGIYITAIYLIIDSTIQSLSIIVFRLATDGFNRLLIMNIVSLLFGISALFLLKRASLISNQIRNSVNLLSKQLYVLIFIVMVFIANLCGNMTVDSYETHFNNRINHFLTAISILLFIIIIISFIFKSISKEYYENLSRLMEKAVDQQLKHYDKVSELNEELREFRHDYKNHMICLQSLMDAQAYQQADEYIKNITKQDIIESKNFFIGNRIADAILTEKAELAEKNGHTVRFNGCISDEISPVDLCTILSNALDNAIEACERIDGSEPLCVKVDGAVIHNVQILKVCNPNDIDSTVTTKVDKEHHGIGLYNIRKTVEKLGGQMKIPQKVPNFILELEFPIRQTVK